MVSQNFKGQTDLTEKWYKTEYSMQKIPEATLEVIPGFATYACSVIYVGCLKYNFISRTELEKCWFA